MLGMAAMKEESKIGKPSLGLLTRPGEKQECIEELWLVCFLMSEETPCTDHFQQSLLI